MPGADDDDVAARLGRLSPARRALAERLLAERARDGGPLPRGGPDLPAPLSFQQARAWPRERAAHRATSLVPSTLRLGPDVALDAMETAWRRLGDRHRALRTVLTGEEEQRGDGPGLGFERLDLTGIAPDQVEAEVDRRARALAAEPMDLAAGPLARARLLRLAPDDHALLIVVHHLVTDAWSQLVCFRELRSLYHDVVAGEGSRPEPALRYADYAAWQRRAAAAGRFDAQLEHRARALAGAPTLLDLPLRPLGAADPWEGFRLGVLDLEVAGSVAGTLRDIARRAGASTFMTLLAAFAAVLASAAGQEEVVVGAPAAGRTRAGLEEVIGFFANPVPLRLRVGRTADFAALLAHARDVATEAFARQEVPLDLLLRRLAPQAPPPGRAPLFQAIVVLQNVGERMARRAGAGADRRPGEAALLPFLPFYSPSSAAFDVGVQLVERQGALTGNLEYDASRVPDYLAGELRERLLGLLARAAARPEAPLGQIL